MYNADGLPFDTSMRPLSSYISVSSATKPKTGEKCESRPVVSGRLFYVESGW